MPRYALVYDVPQEVVAEVNAILKKYLFRVQNSVFIGDIEADLLVKALMEVISLLYYKGYAERSHIIVFEVKNIRYVFGKQRIRNTLDLFEYRINTNAQKKFENFLKRIKKEYK